MDLTRMSSSALSSLEILRTIATARENSLLSTSHTLPMYMEFQFEDNVFGNVGAEMLDTFGFWPNNSVGDISTRPLLPFNPDSIDISYLIWYLCIGVGFLLQLYDSFLSFYYSSLTFKLSNKTALMKYSTRYSLRKGRLIIQVSDKSADCFSLNGFAMSIVGIFRASNMTHRLVVLTYSIDLSRFLIVWWLRPTKFALISFNSIIMRTVSYRYKLKTFYSTFTCTRLRVVKNPSRWAETLLHR